jgi:predicted SnoaL-like aldol condensation-catalyzing enzyme
MSIDRALLAVGLVLLASTVVAQDADPASEGNASSIEQRNAAIAREFYEALWFSDNTDRYDEFMADKYVVHDTGDRKNVTEPAIEQKRIADFFHSQGEMTGSIDFQIAQGDLVATRWQWRLKPETLMFKLLGGSNQIPIINVFRLNDAGKIVEIWNHRHDIDTGVANFKFLGGLAVGLAIALIGWILALVLWRKLKAARASA